MTTNLLSPQNSGNQIFNQNIFFFFLLTGDKNIIMLYTQYLHILHHLQAMKMTFLEVFLICTFKDPKLAEKGPFWRKIQKKFNSAEFMEFFLCLVTTDPQIWPKITKNSMKSPFFAQREKIALALAKAIHRS